MGDDRGPFLVTYTTVCTAVKSIVNSGGNAQCAASLKSGSIPLFDSTVYVDSLTASELGRNIKIWPCFREGTHKVFGWDLWVDSRHIAAPQTVYRVCLVHCRMYGWYHGPKSTWVNLTTKGCLGIGLRNDPQQKNGLDKLNDSKRAILKAAKGTNRNQLYMSQNMLLMLAYLKCGYTYYDSILQSVREYESFMGNWLRIHSYTYTSWRNQINSISPFHPRIAR